MNKYLLAFIFATCSVMPVLSSEVMVDIDFEDKNELYRIKTDNEEHHPVGLFLYPETRFEELFIDSIQNHRFVRKESVEDTYSKSTENLYRQVFDGSVADADLGRAGNASCFDSRDKLISGENGKAVYRTASAPFSSGTGKAISKETAERDPFYNECIQSADKNWYSIPNGSWYQTWNKASGSYNINFDRCEEKHTVYVEDFYRDEAFYKAFDRPLAKVPSKRLMRASVDGALEEIENGGLKQIATIDYKHKFFMIPEFGNTVNKVGCYIWHGNSSGIFHFGGKESTELKPAIESKDSSKRFICCGSSSVFGRCYVIGTDILREWLKKSGLQADKAECTNAVSLCMNKTLKTMVFIYSQPERCIYRFVIDESRDFSIGLPKKYDIDFNVKAMAVAKNGSLYVIPEVLERELPTIENLDDVEMETRICKKSNNNDEEYEKTAGFGESHDKESFELREKIRKMFTTDAECLVVLSQAYYQDFFELPFGADEFEKLDYSLFLGKKYFSINISLKNVSVAALDSDLYTFVELGKRKGNHIGEIVQGAPDFEDTLRKPLSYRIAVREEL